MAARDPRGVLIIDGRCGFCARSADLLRRVDRRGRLEIVASQGRGVLKRYGLTPEQAAASVWFVPGDAPVSRARAGPPRRGAKAPRGGAHPPRGGAHAVGAALDCALGIRLFGPLAAAPVLGAALERGYRWVAANRRRLPGATPWCERGADCEAD